MWTATNLNEKLNIMVFEKIPDNLNIMQIKPLYLTCLKVTNQNQVSIFYLPTALKEYPELIDTVKSKS